jgi:hypothetical protein
MHVAIAPHWNNPSLPLWHLIDPYPGSQHYDSKAQTHPIALRASAASGTHQENTVADCQQLWQLHHAKNKVILCCQLGVTGARSDDILKRGIPLAGRVHAGEQVIQQAHENDHVLCVFGVRKGMMGMSWAANGQL